MGKSAGPTGPGGGALAASFVQENWADWASTVVSLQATGGLWGAMFLLRVLMRVIITFSVLLVLTRLAGKKQLGQVSFFDFVTAIAVGDIAAEKLSDPEHPLLPWMAGTILWFAMAIGLDVLSLRSRRVGRLLEGEPSVLIANGRILEQNLRQNFLRTDDLLAYLRGKGIFNPADVEFAIYETDGTVSVLPRSQVRPVTPRDLGISTPYEGLSQEVIFEGEINRNRLKKMQLTEEWLMNELRKKGLESPRQVFYASVDTAGDLYVSPQVTQDEVEQPWYPQL